MVNNLARAFDMLLDLQRSMDRTQTPSWWGSSTSGRGAFPPVNIFSADDSVVVVAELPGVKQGDVEVQVHKNQLRISGRKNIDYGESASLHRRERCAGAFDRTLSVPFEIDADKVEAQRQQGLLAIRLPRSEADKPRAVKIA
jgi:HSP20 family protein